jgi:hypothetical protein
MKDWAKAGRGPMSGSVIYCERKTGTDYFLVLTAACAGAGGLIHSG